MRPHEPFGIVVAEAMAAGAVPIVHKSGGPWIGILGLVDMASDLTQKRRL